MGKIVYSYYCLDIIHPGHLLQMKNAKRLAGKDGISIIGILTDEAVMEKKPRPIIPFGQRMQIGEAIQYADLVVPQTTYSPIPNVLKIKPDILMESMSHSDELVALSRRTMSELGGVVILTPYYPPQSSTSIKEKIINENHGDFSGVIA
jgi:bifunctional ADP-heptose synthase (sugar kinase/adenylyltransferase)